MKSETAPSASKKIKPKRLVIGWREWIGLPELGIPRLKAKIDTGARTSALHATGIEVFSEQGVEKASFIVPATNWHPAKRVTARLADRREIKNTSGQPELRFIVETVFVLGRRHWKVEISLADRENMEYDMIVGRTALRKHRIAVYADKSFVAGLPEELDTALRSKRN